MFGDYSLGDLGAILAMQGFAGLILFSVYVLMALGLAIIFGQMGVINMAHGEFMILGAYVTWMTSNAFQHFAPALFPHQPREWPSWSRMAWRERRTLGGISGSPFSTLMSTASYKPRNATLTFSASPSHRANLSTIKPPRLWPTRVTR